MVHLQPEFEGNRFVYILTHTRPPKQGEEVLTMMGRMAQVISIDHEEPARSPYHTEPVWKYTITCEFLPDGTVE